MKSRNRLILTGTVVPVSQSPPSARSFRFTLLHPSGGGKPPLSILCRAPVNEILHAGEEITINGCLRNIAGKIEVNVFSIKK